MTSYPPSSPVSVNLISSCGLLSTKSSLGLKESIGNLFFPSTGGRLTTSTPIVGTNRSADFLVSLTDDEYREVYNHAVLPAALSFDLMSKAEFQTFTKLNVPALRSPLRHGAPSPEMDITIIKAS